MKIPNNVIAVVAGYIIAANQKKRVRTVRCGADSLLIFSACEAEACRPAICKATTTKQGGKGG
jgi:hypothetical protein